MKRLWCRLFHRKAWGPAKYFALNDPRLPTSCPRCKRVFYEE